MHKLVADQNVALNKYNLIPITLISPISCYRYVPDDSMEYHTIPNRRRREQRVGVRQHHAGQRRRRRARGRASPRYELELVYQVLMGSRYGHGAHGAAVHVAAGGVRRRRRAYARANGRGHYGNSSSLRPDSDTRPS